MAAAMSVAALGFTGCAMTGGCGCGTGIVAAGGCGDTGCSDCQSSETGDCECGESSWDEQSSYSGMHGEVPSTGYGQGVQNTSMAMTMFDRGPKCDAGCGKFGSGRLRQGLPCRAKGCDSGECDSCDFEEVVEEDAPSRGLLGRLQDANAIALAEQEAQFAAAGGCGPEGCGPGGCAQCAGGIVRHALGQPYGRAVPHTTPTQGPGAGMAPTYAYPYYTTRGPRDFLAREPMSIGY